MSVASAAFSASAPAGPSPLGRILCTLGFLLLAHSGYSTYEHLSYLKVVGRHSDGIPFDIVVECLVATLVFMIGIVYVSGPLREAQLEKAMERQTVEEVESRPSFVTFNNRSRVLFTRT
ncbi:membrane magnesium transporter-domain-containing protein [Thamnocephalis sphaerospora]|uniref:Membrane magnesium transporter-domain-containing protein n=1 Tax=Thamnocephalis sphaerospora TaxID=78915 RepID=A0A4P9XWE0_9FUNG|nr:membrane magnesium transporter-domain-containing protein [Thamnocephalis sphaerospora]|eukprot:RKP10645.1 membrane magnesium transporter-domain-containing protein [Thamnocephalis sphaerospora]